jgi:MgsA AAA+ ATPase C terminal
MSDALALAKQRLTVGLDRQPPNFEPIIADQWVVKSLLQKSIRRGEVEVAQRAALTFLAQKGSALWRRLIVIAFEDVGAGSVDVIAMTVAASTDASWRKQSGGDAAFASHLARLLAEAPKSRSAEHLISSSDQHPSLEQERRAVGTRSIADNLAAVADKSNSLTHRALAGWYVSGIGWEREKVPGSNLPALLDTFRQLGVPEELVAATGIAATKSREPITLMVPLIWLVANDEVPVVVACPVPRAFRLYFPKASRGSQWSGPFLFYHWGQVCCGFCSNVGISHCCKEWLTVIGPRRFLNFGMEMSIRRNSRLPTN